MTQIARIRLTSSELEDIDNVCKSIKEMADRMGVAVKGPIPLPTKKLTVVTRKAPSGEGTHTYDKWELRLHRRIIDLEASERTMAQLTRINIPQAVNIEIRFISK
ncbi:MAG: 30S ribosomal protein S10 [Conexivisphaerales archaeon]